MSYQAEVDSSLLKRVGLHFMALNRGETKICQYFSLIFPKKKGVHNVHPIKSKLFGKKKKGGRLLNYQNERSNNIYLRDTNTGNIYLRGTNTGNSYLRGTNTGNIYLRGTNTGNISLSDISLLCLTSGDGLD